MDIITAKKLSRNPMRDTRCRALGSLLVFENKTDNKKDDTGKNYDRADGVKRQAEPRRQKRENGKTGNGAGNANYYGQ